MRDPLPFLLRYPDADILTSSDHLANTVDVRQRMRRSPVVTR